MAVASIDLDAQLIETGIRDDGTLEVPPGEDGSPGSWYTGSPTPGEPGASLLLGQGNSLTDDSGVFYGIETFAKDEFPTRAVDRMSAALPIVGLSLWSGAQKIFMVEVPSAFGGAWRSTKPVAPLGGS